jgi:hypothetical protein
MVQPKYSPEEALQRIKLMMEYDSSKTYTENKVIVENKIPLNELAPALVLGGQALTWLFGTKLGLATVATGAAATAAVSEYSNATVEEKIRTIFSACGRDTKETSMSDPDHAEIAGIFRDAFAYTMFGVEIPGIGGGTDLDLVKQALGMLKEKGRMGDFCKVRERFGPGTTFEETMIDEMNTKELTWVLNTMDILAAKSKSGSIPIKDQETAQINWWIENFQCLRTTNSFADPINIQADRYGYAFVGVTFKVKGEIKQFNMDKDGKIYIPNPSGQHTYTGKKVNCASDTKVSIVAESVKKKRISEQADLGDIDFSPVDVDLGGGTTTPSPDPGTTPPVRTSGYRSCSGSYSYGCKADAIATVQGCLGGLVVDGKFGPRTKDALKAKGYESFTDAEVDKICGKPTGVDSEISAESPADLDQNNVDF